MPPIKNECHDPRQLHLWLDLTEFGPITDDDPLPPIETAGPPSLEVLEELCRRPPLVPDPPGPTGIRRDNPREQGEIGFTDAIGWFGRRLLTVSVPMIDNQPYDIIADIDGHLAKVQVKTATSRSRYGRFNVMLETAGGNQSFHTRKAWDPTASDVLYIFTDDGDRYVIPSAVVTNKCGLSLGEKWVAYRVPAC